MLNCSQLSRKSNTHNHNSCITSLLIKSQLWLQVIALAELVLSIQCSLQVCCLLSAEIFPQSFLKSFVIEFYNYVLLLTTGLQAEFHKILSFSSFKPRSHRDSSFFPFFLDLFFSGFSQCNNYCCYSLFLNHFARTLEG